MAINPHRRGGSDVPVVDGGTGASTGGAALTNLGGLDTSSHAVVDHSGITGVGATATESVTLGTANSITRAVPGGTLALNNESLEFEIWGFETGVNQITITVTWGATTLVAPLMISNAHFVLRGSIIRTGAATQIFSATSLHGQLAGAASGAVGTGTAAETLSGPVSLTAVGSGGGVANIQGMTIRKWSA
jgi:hypothetical protein